MRKLCLTLAAGLTVLALGATTQRADAMTPGGAGGLRAAIEDASAVDQVRWVCTHWWNGHWHRHARCFWRGHWHHRHHHHHRHY